MIRCRTLGHSDGDGPANMAMDEALLDSVAADPTRAVFRTYTWSVPTLSLGFFQPIARAESEPRWASAPTVRRPTGGGALWHESELTYALVVPPGLALARRNRLLYSAVHDAIAGLLVAAGLPARPFGEAATGPEPASRPFLCFADRDARDLVVGPIKLVGSAQRRRLGAVLQHGSLLLARSATTPELPGLADLAIEPSDPLTWADRLRTAIPAALGLIPEDDSPTDQERDHAEGLERNVYRSAGWTRKR